MNPEAAFFFGMFCGAALLAMGICGVIAYFGRPDCPDAHHIPGGTDDE